MNEQPNLDYIEKLADGDSAIKQRLLLVLKHEFPLEVAKYKANIASSNYLQASENVHKIKHKIGLLGLENSYYLSQIYEKNLRNNLNTNQVDFEQIVTTLEIFLKRTI